MSFDAGSRPHDQRTAGSQGAIPDGPEPELSDEDVIQSYAFRQRQLVRALVSGPHTSADDRVGKLGRGFLGGAALGVSIAVVVAVLNLVQVSSARSAREHAQPAAHGPPAAATSSAVPVGRASPTAGAPGLHP